jgi:CheY-like chemotaxis protein
MPQNAATIGHFLGFMGCEVQAFEHGEDFLAHASRETACVIMNEQMPYLCGHETFHRMRREGWGIPVISEGAWSTQHALELYEGGQVAHLECPWAIVAIEGALRKRLVAAGYCLPPEGVVLLDLDLLHWHDGTILKLAAWISEERAFHYLPILGDALEEAGCTKADVLNHCRQPGEHLRGCWVLDRVHELLQPIPRFDVTTCDKCKQKLRVPNNLGELRVLCPKCKHYFDWAWGLSLLFVGNPPGRLIEWPFSQ